MLRLQLLWQSVYHERAGAGTRNGSLTSATGPAARRFRWAGRDWHVTAAPSPL